MASVIKQARKNARAGMLQTGDNILTNAKRGFRQIGSGISGARAYRATFSQAKSLYAREEMDENIGKKAFKEMHQSIKHASHYDEKHIAKLQKRYGHNPDKFDHHLERLAERFSGDIEVFASALEKYLQAIHDASQRAMLDYMSTEEAYLKLLEDYVTILGKKREIILPKGITKPLKKNLSKIQKRDHKFVKMEVKLDQRILKKDKKGVIGHAPKKIAHNFSKAIKRYQDEHIHDIMRNMKRMQEDIDKGEVRPSFLSYYEQYLSNRKHLAKEHNKIAIDFLLMIERAGNLYEDMVEKILIFKSTFQGYEAVKKIEKELDRLKIDHETLKKIIMDSIESQKNEYKVDKIDKYKIIEQLNKIEKISKENLTHTINESQDKIRHLPEEGRQAA